MLSSKHFKIANFVIFQLIWIAAVIFQSAGLWACILLLAIHFAISPERKADFLRTYKAILIGITLDFTLMQAGVYVFEGDYFPLWLVCLWIGFVLTLRHSMAWLAEKPLYWQIILGACGGTLSYLSGSRFGAVELGMGIWVTAIILVIAWGLLLPIFYRLVNRAHPHEQLA
ncbi:DUF2878 domain-containing protein [Planctobacterium marinum]|uniref:Membrane protein n=1 Tax=Planctobacterium marinum TaxID=1631968 RepID=A0AA48HZ55_9ALTE|nr:membrane protein [Planctobacterium marinum]